MINSGTEPDENLSLREGRIGTAVGYPVMHYGYTDITPNRMVSMTSTKYNPFTFGLMRAHRFRQLEK